MTRKPPGQDWLPIRLVKESNFWRSLIRQPYPTTSRTRALAVMNNVFLHLHPVRVKRHAVRYTYTFCLGGVSFFLFLVLTVTGLYLMFFYIPSVDRAYQDIIAIENSVAFGSLVRNMHRWGAHLMVLTVFLHMMRVFYHGAYKPPREWNWAVGTFLLFCTLWLSFTGYLLPWDQIAFWAVTVGTQMAAYAPLVRPSRTSSCSAAWRSARRRSSASTSSTSSPSRSSPPSSWSSTSGGSGKTAASADRCEPTDR